LSAPAAIADVVVDASITLAWLLGETETAEPVMREAERRGILAPALWVLEIANGIAMAARRKRIQSNQRQILLKLVAGLSISLDPARTLADALEIDALAARHDLTIYDAAYLELAIRRRSALASLDRDLRAAAAREGVPVLPA
jgi:predicted nucleic acid-binding protein